MGWQALIANHVYLVGHTSASFVYVVSGAHALHALVGVLLFLGVGLRAFLGLKKKETKYVQLSTIYWHFVGLLWVYLYAFLSLAR